MKIDFLIFQHSAGSPPGTTLNWLDKNQFQYHIHFWGKHSFESLHQIQFKSLIILGGPQNVDEEIKYPWLAQEKHFIKNTLQEKKPVLGICLGGQLIAEVLGAKVTRNQHWEIGWHPINFFPLENSPFPKVSELIAFQYHAYCFEIPSETFKAATNSITPNQAYCNEMGVIGLQFHPETTKEWVLDRCHELSESPQLTGTFIQSCESIKAELYRQESLQQWYFELLENWHLKNKYK